MSHAKTDYVRVKHRQGEDDGKVGLFGFDHSGSRKHRRLFGCWSFLINRCYNPSSKSYKNYGEAGITVCKRWHIFENFLNDILNTSNYAPELQIDKDIFGSKQYSPTTCLLISKEDNLQLLGTPVKVCWRSLGEEHEKVFLSLREASGILGISITALQMYFLGKTVQGSMYGPSCWVRDVSCFKVEEISIPMYTILRRDLATKLNILFEEL